MPSVCNYHVAGIGAARPTSGSFGTFTVREEILKKKTLHPRWPAVIYKTRQQGEINLLENNRIIWE